MQIKLHSIPVKDIFDGYVDKDDDGVVGYGGKLDIRPPYQRNFVYDDPDAESVIHTILRKPMGFPLGVMYWVKTGEDTYEVLDGQQRTLSIMRYRDHQFPITIDGKSFYWDSLPDDLYEQLMNYELMIYICEGTSSEKLEWFEIVNKAGKELTKQELRNKSYTGAWLSDAKLHFSKRNCAAKGLSDRYVKGDPNRQELLEKALMWIANAQDTTIEEYMSNHQHDNDADELWQYFQDVIHWIEKIFPDYYPAMKGLEWGMLYNKHHNKSYNSSTMRAEVKRLMTDEEVQKRAGIFEYLLTRDEDPFAAKLLSLRTFTERDKQAAFSRQNGMCAMCKRIFAYAEMAGDHIKPWSKGGLTVPENCQMLCRECNSKKSDMY